MNWIPWVPRGADRSGVGTRVIVVAVLAVVVVVAVMLGGRRESSAPGGDDGLAASSVDEGSPSASAGTATGTIPRLVDLGAGKCAACKAMAPILDELRETYDGEFEVVFIDVWKNRDAAREYGVQVIPTQIFYDPSGNELFRHQGFLSRAAILAKWEEFGFEFDG